MLPAHGTQGAEADGPVGLDVPEQLQQPLLPEQGPLVLLEKGDRFLLEHPAEEVVDVLEMVVEVLPPDAAALRQVVDGDLVDGPLGHKLLQRRGQGSLGLVGDRVGLFSIKLLPSLSEVYHKSAGFSSRTTAVFCRIFAKTGGVDLCLSAQNAVHWKSTGKGAAK